MLTLHLVDFVDFVLGVGKEESCLLAEIVVRELSVLVKTAVGLVAETQLSRRPLYRRHPPVDLRWVVLVAEVVAQAQEGWVHQELL